MVKWILMLSAAVVVSICVAERDVEESDNIDERKSKNLRDGFKGQEWRAVDTSANPEWISRVQEENPDRPLMRRRRIRKRKRRPPQFFDDYEDYAPLRRRRRKRPQRLEDADDSWSEIENESYQRAHKRRRIYPLFFPDTNEEPKNQNFERVRDPFTALEETELKTKKQKESLEMVENTEEIKDYTTSEENISAVTESIQNSESATRQEEEQTVTIAKYEVITEPVTEKRIFVPSHPQLYTTFKYKPDIDILTQPTETPTTTKIDYGNKIIDYRTKYQLLKPKLKLSMNSRPKTTTESLRTSTIESIPENAVKISVGDDFVKKQQSQDGPIRMVFDIDKIIARGTITPFPLAFSSTTEKEEEEVIVTTKSPVYEKVFATTIKTTKKGSSAKEEIMEVLKDQTSRKNLSRILQMRNMTIDELVEQRERGSSQLHLADIFHNQTKEPEPPNEPFIGIPFFYNPFGSRRSKAFNLTPSIHEEVKNKEEYIVTNFPKFKIERATPSPPPRTQFSIWKTLYPSLNDDFFLTNTLTNSDNYQRAREILENEVRRIENVENKISDVAKDRLNVDVPNYEKSDYFNLPSGVKSAIIASFAIIGLSLFVFFTIFIVFKWSQKQHKRLCYAKSFSCTKIKAPILENEPRKTLRSFVNETLGRKRKYKNMYPHDLSDYTWDHDKKPFQ